MERSGDERLGNEEKVVNSDERIARFKEIYGRGNDEWLAATKRFFAEQGWGDPELITQEQHARNLETIYELSRGIDLFKMLIQRRREVW